ncbi:MAG: L-aspartate oxidase, partial [Planctomycetota bacterium]
MILKTDFRRYLVNIDTVSTHQLFTDCLIIGAGIAGLHAAIAAADNRNVILLCKSSLDQSNTFNAQGGIASVLEKTDSFESHISDTIKTGCGICDEKIVAQVIRQGPALVKQLLEWGAEFDMEQGRISATREGGHSHQRIAHCHGDETGRVIVQTLIEKVCSNPNIKILENFYVIDLLTSQDNQCLGIIGRDSRGTFIIIWSAATILASGGAGQLYRETTNPSVATADGLAMAYRAGAVLQDLEFMQFHPTTLYVAGASRALITETLRGEGAILLDNTGYRFMPDYHQAAELAPRDVVSRAILSQM